MKHMIAGSCPTCFHPMIVLLNNHNEQVNACPRCHYAYSNAREFKQKVPKLMHKEIWKYIYNLFHFKDLDDMQFTYVKKTSEYINNGEPLKNIKVLDNPSPKLYKIPLDYETSKNHKCFCEYYSLLRSGCKCGGV